MITDVAKDRARRESGTYGPLGALRHPSRILRHSAPSESQSNIEGLQRGEVRSVTCFLQGSSDPYPLHLKQGTLLLSGNRATWKPYWNLKRRRPLRIEGEFQAVTTRAADRRESEVVKTGGGGRALGMILVPTFVVVTCTTPTLSVDFVVPSADETLVADFFKSTTSR